MVHNGSRRTYAKMVAWIMVSSALILAPAGCKSDDGGDGSVPTELAGKWTPQLGDKQIEFTAEGEFKYPGNTGTYSIKVYGGKVIATNGGSFTYSIQNSLLMITTESPVFKNLQNNSPFVRVEE